MSSISTRITRLEVAAGKVVQAKPVDEHELFELWLGALCESRHEISERLILYISPKSVTELRADVAEIEAKGNPPGLVPKKKILLSMLATGALWLAILATFDAADSGDDETINRANDQLTETLHLPDGVEIYWRSFMLPRDHPARQRPAYQRYLSTIENEPKSDYN